MKLDERLRRLEARQKLRRTAEAGVPPAELVARCRATIARLDKEDPRGIDLSPAQRELVAKARAAIARIESNRENHKKRAREARNKWANWPIIPA